MTALGYKDEKLNQFKLIIYDWNVDQAVKYYKDDIFCHLYCICPNNFEEYKQYGCPHNKPCNLNKSFHRNNNLTCRFHSKCLFAHIYNLESLIIGNQNQRDHCMAQLLCLYLFYLHKYDNNPQLYDAYGLLLRKMSAINTTKDKIDCTSTNYLQSERYFLKALEISSKFHCSYSNYAGLLRFGLNDHNKAERYYKMALNLCPNHGTANANFSSFLRTQRAKSEYQESIVYATNACNLDPYYYYGHYEKGLSLYCLGKFEESRNELKLALYLNEKDIKSNNSCYEEMSQNEIFEAQRIVAMASAVCESKRDLDDDDNLNDDDEIKTNEQIDKEKQYRLNSDNKHTRGSSARGYFDTKFDELNENIIYLSGLIETCNKHKVDNGLRLTNVSQLKRKMEKCKAELDKSKLDFETAYQQMQAKIINCENKYSQAYSQLEKEYKTSITTLEKSWYQWDIDQTIEWIKYILGNCNLNLDNGNTVCNYNTNKINDATDTSDGINDIDSEAMRRNSIYIDNAKLTQQGDGNIPSVDCNSVCKHNMHDNEGNHMIEITGGTANNSLIDQDYVIHDLDASITNTNSHVYGVNNASDVNIDINVAEMKNDCAKSGDSQIAMESIDFETIRSNLHKSNFIAKYILPTMDQDLLIHYGFKNKQHCALICLKKDELIAKYPNVARCSVSLNVNNNCNNGKSKEKQESKQTQE